MIFKNIGRGGRRHIVWLGDFKQGGCQPEISLAKEIAKVECKGHPVFFFLDPNQMSAQNYHLTAD
jgi:hypothetical protein